MKSDCKNGFFYGLVKSMKEYIELFLITLLYTGIILCLLRLYVWRQKIKKNESDKFIKKLLNCIENGSLSSLKDVEDIHTGHFLDRRKSRYHSIEILLKRAKLTISSIATANTDQGQKNLQNINKLIGEIENKQLEAKSKEPFAGVPDPERSTLEDLRELCGARENNFIHEKFIELAKSIQVRKDTVDKLSNDNLKSLRWAKLGLLGTVFFGLLSLVVTYYKP